MSEDGRGEGARVYREKQNPIDFAGGSVKSRRRQRLSLLQGFSQSHRLKIHRLRRRVRLKDARNRLLNPNLRVGEIAYDVGFQSLTQFNRTFKRVFGQSPSEFRARLSSRKRAGKPA
jgi:transcriptional regulator GlxA family with amidase domain